MKFISWHDDVSPASIARSFFPSSHFSSIAARAALPTTSVAVAAIFLQAGKNWRGESCLPIPTLRDSMLRSTYSLKQVYTLVCKREVCVWKIYFSKMVYRLMARVRGWTSWSSEQENCLAVCGWRQSEYSARPATAKNPVFPRHEIRLGARTCACSCTCKCAWLSSRAFPPHFFRSSIFRIFCPVIRRARPYSRVCVRACIHTADLHVQQFFH